MIVIVTRWYGGIHLGTDRFKHINNCARQVLEAQGYITSSKKVSSPLQYNAKVILHSDEVDRINMWYCKW